MWSSSEQDTCPSNAVWGRLEHPEWSYNDFISHGKSLKTRVFDKISSLTCEDCQDQIWSQVDEI